jgi:hypothetical protein
VTTPTVDLPPALDFLPRTPVAAWERWLGWRYPHYDAMESRAAATQVLRRARGVGRFAARRGRMARHAVHADV